MAKRHCKLVSELRNVIPNLFRNPLNSDGMLKQVQHDAGRWMLKV